MHVTTAKCLSSIINSGKEAEGMEYSAHLDAASADTIDTISGKAINAHAPCVVSLLVKLIRICMRMAQSGLKRGDPSKFASLPS